MNRLLGPLNASGDAREHGQHLVGVGAGADDALLRAPQAGRRHHLHGAGDLLSALYRANAAPEIENVGHGLVES